MNSTQLTKEIKVVLEHYGIDCDVSIGEERTEHGYLIRGLVTFDLPSVDVNQDSVMKTFRPFIKKIEESPYHQVLSAEVNSLRARVRDLERYEDFYHMYKDIRRADN